MPALALSVLIVATTSGFALGSANRPQDPAKPAQAAASQPKTGARAGGAADVHTVNATLSHLLARREAVLHRLHRALRPAAQASAAVQLAQAYGAAADALPAKPRSALHVEEIAARLRASQNAYMALASAAKTRNVGNYRAARRAIPAREAELEDAVKTLARQADALSQKSGA